MTILCVNNNDHTLLALLLSQTWKGRIIADTSDWLSISWQKIPIAVKDIYIINKIKIKRNKSIKLIQVKRELVYTFRL